MFGCFTIFIESVSPVHLILLENSFWKLGKPERVFDLKGSLINRKSDSKSVGKDLDFLEDERFITLS